MSELNGGESRSLRVLARPYKNTAEPAQGRVYDEMVANGHVVEDLTLKRLLTERWDIAHLHYPEAVLRRSELMPSLVAVGIFAAIIVVCRLRNVRVVGTGHNTQSHEQHHPRLERIVIGLFDRAVGAMTFPTETARQAVVAGRPRLEDVHAEIVPLANYRWERDPVDRDTARRTWNVDDDAIVVLFMGLIRSYKNVPELIRAARASNTERLVLIVAGGPRTPEIEHEVRDAAGDDARVILELRYIEANEVSSLMRAADLVVLPFTAVLNSASTLLAISHDRPVMVPRTGSLVELAERVGPEWFHFFDGAISGPTIDSVVGELDQHADSRAEPPDLAWCDLETIVDETTTFYASLVD